MTGIDTPFGRVTPDLFVSDEAVMPRTCVLGPKFVYAMFDPEVDAHAVAYAFLTYVRDEALPYRRFVLNEHTVDEAATRLKKRAGMGHARSFVDTLERSELFELTTLSVDTFDRAIQRFSDWDDNAASFTDFTIGTQMESLELSHLMTFDSHLDMFDVHTYPPLRGRSA